MPDDKRFRPNLRRKPSQRKKQRALSYMQHRVERIVEETAIALVNALPNWLNIKSCESNCLTPKLYVLSGLVSPEHQPEVRVEFRIYVRGVILKGEQAYGLESSYLYIEFCCVLPNIRSDFGVCIQRDWGHTSCINDRGTIELLYSLFGDEDKKMFRMKFPNVFT